MKPKGVTRNEDQAYKSNNGGAIGTKSSKPFRGAGSGAVTLRNCD